MSTCCHHTGQPKHQQRPEKYERLCCTASVFLKIFWSVFLWFLAPWSCAVHCWSVPWWGKHVTDPHMGTQSCCPLEAPCTLPTTQHPRPQGSSSLLHCRRPRQSPFYCILCPFSRWSLETANQRTDFGPKTGVTGVRWMALPRRDVLLAQNWTSTPYKTLLMQDKGHRWSTPSSSWTALWWPTWSQREPLWLCEGFRPPYVTSQATAQAGATQRLPACLCLPLLPDLEALILAALRGVGVILFLQDYSCTATIRARDFHPTQIFHQWPEKEEMLTANHPSRSFKTQQIPHQGGELVFSLTGPFIYLFKGYPSSEWERIPSPWRSVLPSSSDLQQDSQTFPGSLHP